MKLKIALAAAAAALTMSSGAEAAYAIDAYTFNPGMMTGNINYTPTNYSLNVFIGRLNLTGTETPGNTPVSFLTYCVDIFNTLSVPATFDFAPVSTLIPDTTRQSRLLTLIGMSDTLIDQAANKNEASAAIQLATWEIVNEDTASYGFATGTFRSSGGNSDGARTLAQSYLDNIANGTWQPGNGTLKLLYSADSQSQILTAVPEPATWAMMIGGFAFIGAAMRRRKTNTTVVYA